MGQDHWHPSAASSTHRSPFVPAMPLTAPRQSPMAVTGNGLGAPVVPAAVPRAVRADRRQLPGRGAHPKVVSERLGHASVNITLDTYSHVLPGLQEAAALALDSLLAKPARTEGAG